MVSPTRIPAVSVRCNAADVAARLPWWVLKRAGQPASQATGTPRSGGRSPVLPAAAPVSSLTPISGGLRLRGLPAVRQSAASRARAHTMPSTHCRSETLMRGAVSKWAAEEEAAQMLYGKLGVLLASVLWLDAQGAPQVGISGPYSHEGLAILLIHHNAPTWTEGRIKASTLHYLTLEQALNQKKVVVHETNQVNEVAVENNSPDAVFISPTISFFRHTRASFRSPRSASNRVAGAGGEASPLRHLLVQQNRLLPGSSLNRCGIRSQCGTRLWSCRRRSRLTFASRTTQPC